MRLKKFLSEEAQIADVHRDCAPFLQEWKSVGLKNGLLRGIKATFDVQKADATKYRLPRDIMLSNSDWVDNIYKSNLGVSLRNSAVFCTHNEKMASYYGNVYYAVPIGSYKLYVNSKIRDLFTDVFAYQDTPFLCQTGQILDPMKIAQETTSEDGVRIPSDVQALRIKSTSRRVLLPFLLTRPVKDRTMRLAPEYLSDDNLIFEGIFSAFGKKTKQQKEEVKGRKLTSQEAYDLFWKSAFKNLEVKVVELLKKTRRMSLAETCNYKDNEIMLTCKEYYLVSKELMSEL